MTIIFWLLFGALIGWITSLIMRTDAEQGVIGNIVIGIIGAFIGGFLSSLVGGPSVTGFNIPSILVSVVGAVILVFIIRAITSSRHTTV